MYLNFVEFALTKGATNKNKSEIKSAEEITKAYLKAFIGRNIFGNECFYPAIMNTDKAYLKAIDVIRKMK